MPEKSVALNLTQILIAVLFIVGIALFILSFAPFSAVKPLVDGLALDGSVESFTPQAFSVLVSRFRILGILFAGFALVSFIFRVRLARWAVFIPGLLSKIARRLVGDLRGMLDAIARLRSDGLYLAGLIGVMVVGLVLRLFYLNQPMRYDEAYTYLIFAVRPLKFFLSDYHVPNNHIFHTLLVALSTRLLGDAPWAIRLPAFLGGTLLIPVSYLLARQRYNAAAGLLASALVAANSFLIEYATNARGYILMALMTLVIILLADYARRHENILAWLLFVLISSLGFYTLPTMLYPFGGVILWLFLTGIFEHDSGWGKWKYATVVMLSGLGVVLLTFLFYLPIIRGAGIEAITNNRFVSPLEWDVFLRELPGSLISTWRGLQRDMPVGYGLVMGLGFLLSFLPAGHPRRFQLHLAIPLLAWCAFLVSVQRVAPWARVWIFLMPLFLIWASGGLVKLLTYFSRSFVEKPHPALIAGVLVVSVFLGWSVARGGGVLASTQTGTLPDAPQIIRDYIQDSRPGDVIVSDLPSNYPLRYYVQYYDLPEEILYLPKYHGEFERALVVVNKVHGPDFERVVEKWRIEPFLDMSTKRLWKAYPTADVYIIQKRK